MSDAEVRPDLSVVVIGRNEGERLRRCLTSIGAVRALPRGLETIYVDSASTDGSPQAAAAVGARVVELPAGRPSAARGRNAGWALAGADLVLFLDGDTIVDPDFPRAALDELARDPTVAAVWGHRREIHPERSIYNRVLDLDWIFRPGFTDYCGGDVVMRRRVLEEVNGYDAELIAGEEPELCRRIRAKGHRILHVDRPMTGHDLAILRFGQYWRRATRTGFAYAEVSHRFRATSDPLWTPERRRNLVRGGFWLASVLGAVIVALAERTPWPVLAWLALLGALSLRSAWKVRWKSRDRLALLLYGLHSHLQQIPILVGQLQHAAGAAAGKKRALIEYKG